MLVFAVIIQPVFPAPAGVILAGILASNKLTSFPRTCGGDPFRRVYRRAVEMFSPHLRG